jgi:membrane protein DedA with SNARE-associated domain
MATVALVGSALRVLVVLLLIRDRGGRVTVDDDPWLLRIVLAVLAVFAAAVAYSCWRSLGR